MLPLARARAKLFDQEAERYDRSRPAYPSAVIEKLLGPGPAGLDVLDVGCGTGIASRQVAGQGADVVGIDVAPRMAGIARNHGVNVEISTFEDWNAAGRTFDRVISAQAWHWLDLPTCTTKAASLLRPGGRLCLMWNAGCHPANLADALSRVYARWFPSVGSPGFGYAASRPTDRRTGLTSVFEAIAAVPDFGPATESWFPWAREYDRDQWLDVLLSRSDHLALDSAVRERLLGAVGAAIADYGGSFVMSFETGLITATRLP
jgi:SAM-dependent methyltransferase